MIDPNHVPEVRPAELLARFVLQSNHIRKQNQSVKPDAFLQAANLECSVTRHLLATEADLWEVGKRIAALRQRVLYGRADIAAAVCVARKIRVVAAPIPGNPNQANISGWPEDKPTQKLIAQEIAAVASFSPAIELH